MMIEFLCIYIHVVSITINIILLSTINIVLLSTIDIMYVLTYDCYYYSELLCIYIYALAESPSGNKTRQWELFCNWRFQWEKSSIDGGCSIATFEYQRVYIISG